MRRTDTLEELRADLRRLRLAVSRPAFRDITASGRIRRRRLLKPSPAVPCGPRRFRFIAARQVVSRNGDVLVIRGLHLDHYMRWSRRVFWEHDETLSIGRAVLVGTILDDPVPHLQVVVEFDRGPLADRVFEGYRDGSLTGMSPAFYHRKHHRPTAGERRRYDTGPGALIIDEADLLELSCVRDPADPGARILGAPATSAEPRR